MARAQGDRYEEAVILRVMADSDRRGRGLDGPGGNIGAIRSKSWTKSGPATNTAISMFHSADLTLSNMENGRAGSRLPARPGLGASHPALDLFLRVDVPWWTESRATRWAGSPPARRPGQGRQGGAGRGHDRAR